MMRKGTWLRRAQPKRCPQATTPAMNNPQVWPRSPAVSTDIQDMSGDACRRTTSASTSIGSSHPRYGAAIVQHRLKTVCENSIERRRQQEVCERRVAKQRSGTAARNPRHRRLHVHLEQIVARRGNEDGGCGIIV